MTKRQDLKLQGGAAAEYQDDGREEGGNTLRDDTDGGTTTRSVSIRSGFAGTTRGYECRMRPSLKLKSEILV